MDLETIFEFSALLLFLLLRAVAEWVKKRRERQREPAPVPTRGGEQVEPGLPPGIEWPTEAEVQDEGWPLPGGDGAGPLEPFAEQRRQLLGRLEEIEKNAERIVLLAQTDRATQGLAAVLQDFVKPRAAKLKDELAAGEGPPEGEDAAAIDELELIANVVDALVAQRQTPSLRSDRIDADALALACYQPIIEFARSARLGLTSQTPAVLFSGFDGVVWHVFLPTRVAPIFLPPDFFARLARWPELGREIGHDFLAATRRVEPRLRTQLGLVDEFTGRRLLHLEPRGLAIHDLRRVVAGWFAEIFSDVFATLMTGPAYGHSLVELLSSPADVTRIIQAGFDPIEGLYDSRPPPHLRVHLCAQVLNLVGEGEHAGQMVARWSELHGDIDAIVLPVHGGLIGIPATVFGEIVAEIGQRLCRESLAALGGSTLAAVPGLAWDPIAATEARRAAEPLLAGRVPVGIEARFVIAGAVLAWRDARARETEMIGLARGAVTAVPEPGAGVHARAYVLPPERAVAAAPGRGGDLRDALILHTVLAPPPALARRHRHRGSLLERRSAPWW